MNAKQINKEFHIQTHQRQTLKDKEKVLIATRVKGLIPQSQTIQLFTTYQEQRRPEGLKLPKGNDYQLRILHPLPLFLNNAGKKETCSGKQRQRKFIAKGLKAVLQAAWKYLQAVTQILEKAKRAQEMVNIKGYLDVFFSFLLLIS